MNIILDFDSTIVGVESLDVLAELCIADSETKELFHSITSNAMQGSIDFNISLEQRISMMIPQLSDIEKLIQVLKSSITNSIFSFLNKLNLDNVYVISGGFYDYILPITNHLGISRNRVFANQFIYHQNQVVDFKRDNYLLLPQGKSKLISTLNLENPIVMIGDGFTDLETKLSNSVNLFIAYTEHSLRKSVVEQADFSCQNFDEVYSIIKDL